MQAENMRPTVLCFGGLDPSGGAGIQADIETIAYCGGHALPIATCLTVQNTQQAYSTAATAAPLLRQQAEALLKDFSINSCKIGVIPDSEVVIAIADIIKQLPDIPVVLDPVLQASSGSKFCDEKTINSIKDILLPLVSVATPNASELAILSANKDSSSQNAIELCRCGPQYVLVTDADNPAPEVSNKLFTVDGLVKEYHWTKLPHAYHGSGCTLSSALAYYLTTDLKVSDAAMSAQQYTWQCLQTAEPLGQGQRIPHRVSAQQRQ